LHGCGGEPQSWAGVLRHRAERGVFRTRQRPARRAHAPRGVAPVPLAQFGAEAAISMTASAAKSGGRAARHGIQRVAFSAFKREEERLVNKLAVALVAVFADG
jgi:hypothetical protein